MGSKFLLSGLCLGALTVPAAATTNVYQQGAEITVDNIGTGLIYDGTQDTELRASSAGTNFGSASEITVDGNNPHAQALIRFDDIFGNGPGQIPLGSIIHTADLFINVTNNGGNPSLYRLTTDWDESTATWNSFGGGVSGTNGIDTGVDFDEGDQPIDVTAQVQLWAAGTANYGWAFLPTSSNGIDFDSSEASTIASRPQLSIHFEVVPEPGSLALLALGSAMLLRRRR